MDKRGGISNSHFFFLFHFNLFFLHLYNRIVFREEEVSSCQDQLGEFRSAAGALSKWLEETNEKVPAAQPSSSTKNLEKDLQIVSVSQEIHELKD